MRRDGAAWLAVVLLFLLAPRPAAAFWLLGFSPADTLPPGGFAAIAGTGGQYSSVGNPHRSSFTPFLPHAGLRYGLADSWDIGYRLTQVALPYSGVGPSLGGEIDVKHRLTAPGPGWQAAIVLGAAYSYLDISGIAKSAYSPGVDLVLSRLLTPRTTLITELRYVYTAIPSAAGGSGGNHVNATGVDLGARFALTQAVSLVPEVGVFDFAGRLRGQGANGIAAQYGAVLGFRF